MKFKIGDKVTHQYHGDGVVVSIRSTRVAPYHVKLTNSETIYTDARKIAFKNEGHGQSTAPVDDYAWIDGLLLDIQDQQSTLENKYHHKEISTNKLESETVNYRLRAKDKIISHIEKNYTPNSKSKLQAQFAYEAGVETYDIKRIEAKAKLDGAIEELEKIDPEHYYLLHRKNQTSKVSSFGDLKERLATLKEERSKL